MILLFMREVFVKDIYEYWIFPIMLHSTALGKMYSRFSWKVKATQLCPTLCNPNSPSRHTGVGSLSLLQEIFPTQGLNPGLPHCRWILYQLSHKESPRILEWVAYTFSGSSWPRNQTGVSCIAGGFFTNWATGESHRFSIFLYFLSSRCIFCFFKCIYFTAVTLL